MRLKIIFLVLFLFGCVIAGKTQSNNIDLKLAREYFITGDYEKAIIYFNKLYKEDPNDSYYSYLYRSFMAIEDYQDAEKLVIKHMKNLKDAPSYYYIQLGAVYLKENKTEKAYRTFDKAIKLLSPYRYHIMKTASEFVKLGLYDYALKTYEKGQKIVNEQYPFNVEVAEIYEAMGKYDLMIKELLDLLEINSSYIYSVQNAISRALQFGEKDKINQELKQQLLQRIQKKSDNKAYVELLIWHNIQTKDFYGAFVQAKALDKRLKEKGSRIFSLAQICRSNKQYDLALKCYEYLIQEKDQDNYYHKQAEQEYLATLKEKILYSQYTEEDIKKLSNKYKHFFEEKGMESENIQVLRDFAHLKAYYEHDLDSAILLINQAFKIPYVLEEELAKCKLDLGDYLLMKGDIWEAALYYAQVDKAYKHEPLGAVAKYKTAKIHFYTGSFKLAKAMLDVLKGSTSKLIANDALQLSILISDNSTIDTTTVPLKMYARADLLVHQNRFSEAEEVLDSILVQYPGHTLTDEIYYTKYQIAFRQRHYQQAAEWLKKIIDEFPDDILTDDALYHLAQIYDYQLNNIELAKETYKKIILNHPDSVFAVEARKRYRQLRGDKLDDEES